MFEAGSAGCFIPIGFEAKTAKCDQMVAPGVMRVDKTLGIRYDMWDVDSLTRFVGQAFRGRQRSDQLSLDACGSSKGQPHACIFGRSDDIACQ